jgi:hypothetical protein
MSDAGHGGVPHSLFLLVEMMAKSLYETNLRALALSRLLVDHSVISGEELNALMREMDEVTDLDVEFSDKPEHVAWRELRQKLRQIEGERPAGGDESPRSF